MSSEVPRCIKFVNIELCKLVNGLVHETRFGLVISRLLLQGMNFVV